MEKKVYETRKGVEEILSNQTSEDTIEVIEIMNILAPIAQKWQKLLNVLIEESEDFDNHSKVHKIIKKNHQVKNYYVLYSGIWDYLCMDIDQEERVELGQNLAPLGMDFFVQYFDQKYLAHPEVIYYSLNITKEGLKKIFYILENNPELLEEPKFYYQFRGGNQETIRFLFNATTAEVRIKIESKGKELSDLFLDKGLTLIGTSTSLKNINDFKQMIDDITKIKLPKKIIPKVYQKTKGKKD